MQNYPVNLTKKPQVEAFFDPKTNTISYVVVDLDSKACAVVDSVMDIDYASGAITHESADKILEFIISKGLNSNGSLKPMCTQIIFLRLHIYKISLAEKSV